MWRVTLFVLSLFVSFSAFAANANIGNEITKNIVKQNENNHGQNAAIVYGGKDISRSIIATANESTWTKKPTYIG